MAARSPLCWIAALALGGGTPACEGSSATDAAKPAGPAKAAPPPAPAKRELPDLPSGPVATVDGNEISSEAFIELYRPLIARTGRSDVPRSMQRRFQERVLRRLVYQEQLRLAMRDAGTDYDPAALEKRLAERKAEYADWADHLKKVAETEVTVRQDIIEDLREAKILEPRIDRNVTGADVKRAYEEAKPRLTSEQARVHAAHFMFVIAPRDEDGRAKKVAREEHAAASASEKQSWREAALGRAKAMRAEALRPGADFRELVRRHSEGPGASRGGDMGYFGGKQMIPAYTKAAQALKIGEISEPVLTERGYFVIKLFDRQPPGTIPLKVVRDSIAESVLATREREAYAGLVEELDRKYPVEILMKLATLNKAVTQKDDGRTAADAKSAKAAPP